MSTGTRVQYDPMKHRPAERRIVWDTLPGYDGVSAITQVILLESATEHRDEAEERTGKVPSEQVTPRKYDYFDAVSEHSYMLTPAEHRMLMKFWRHSDGNLRNARPSRATVAKHMSWSGKHALTEVSKMIATLVRKGFMVQTSPGTNRGANRAAVYRLTLPGSLPIPSHSGVGVTPTPSGDPGWA